MDVREIKMEITHTVYSLEHARPKVTECEQALERAREHVVRLEARLASLKYQLELESPT